MKRGEGGAVSVNYEKEEGGGGGLGASEAVEEGTKNTGLLLPSFYLAIFSVGKLRFCR